ncbi:MAG: hypothetical protein WCG51_00830, partial [Elusimicrobiota bacterium]
MEDIKQSVVRQAMAAKTASRKLALLSTEQKNAILLAMADALDAQKENIIFHNEIDVDAAFINGALQGATAGEGGLFADVGEGAVDKMGQRDEGSAEADLFDNLGGERLEFDIVEAAEAGEGIGILAGGRAGRG